MCVCYSCMCVCVRKVYLNFPSSARTHLLIYNPDQLVPSCKSHAQSFHLPTDPHNSHMSVNSTKHTHSEVYTHTRVRAHSTHRGTHTHKQACAHIHIFSQTHTYTPSYTRTHTHTNMLASPPSLSIYTDTHTTTDKTKRILRSSAKRTSPLIVQKTCLFL